MRRGAFFSTGRLKTCSWPHGEGKYEQALEAYSKSLDIKIKVASQDQDTQQHGQRLQIDVYQSQGAYEEAFFQYGKAQDS